MVKLLYSLALVFLFFDIVSANNQDIYVRAKEKYKLNPTASVLTLDSALAQATEQKNTAEIIQTNKLLGYAFYYQQKFPEAILHFQQGLYVAGQADSLKEQFNISNALGACYKFVGDYGKAIEYFNQAYVLAEADNNKTNLAKSCNNLGVLLRLNKQFQQSAKILKRAKDIYSEERDSLSLGETLNNLGLSYVAQDSLKLAREYYQKSLELKKSLSKKTSYAKTLNNLALVEQELGNLQIAKALFEEAIIIAENENQLYSIASFKINLVDVLIQMELSEPINQLLFEVELLIQSNNFTELKPRLYKLKSNLAYYQKNYEQALFYRDKHQQAKDSLFTSELKQSLANATLVQKIETEKNKNEILAQQLQIQALKIDQQRWKYYFLLLAIMLLFVLVAYFYLRFNKIKRLNILLKQKEVELNKEKAAAIEANNHKSDFLAKMSHEIRTPLAAIRASAELLGDSNSRSDEKMLVEILQHSSETLMNLVNDILDVSKIESGKFELREEEVVIDDLLNEVLGTQKIVVKQKNIDLKVDSDVEFEKIVVDGLRLKQILINLLGNAVKFTHQGYVKLKITADKSFQKTDEFINLNFEVEDTGIGIDNADLVNILQPFTQVYDSTKSNFGGTGLGLTISNYFVDLMGGKLQVKSVLNQGTTFWFSIPVKIKLQDSSTGNEKEIKPSSANKSKHQILLVEDNKMNQQVFKMGVSKLDVPLIIANNGVEGLNAYTKELPKLVFMDIKMPEMDGEECTKRIREFESANKLEPATIVAFTANALKGDKERYLSNGFNEFLPKPFSTQKLKEIALKYLGAE